MSFEDGGDGGVHGAEQVGEYLQYERMVTTKPIRSNPIQASRTQVFQSYPSMSRAVSRQLNEENAERRRASERRQFGARGIEVLWIPISPPETLRREKELVGVRKKIKGERRRRIEEEKSKESQKGYSKKRK